MRLVMIRHGESHHSLRGVIGGPKGCTGLTEKGRSQARALAKRLKSTGELHPCQAILSSPLPRARETASALEEVLGPGAVREDPDLFEIRPGAADGLTWTAFRSRYEQFDLPSFPERPFSPGGESWRAFLERVETTCCALAERYDSQTVAAVTHSGFIVAAMLVIFGIPRPGTGAWLEPTHTSMTEWEVTDRRWKLVRYNDVCHLLGGVGG